MRYLLAGILALSVAGCSGSGSTTSPSDASVTGTWVGAINNTSLGRENLTTALVQSGTTVSGTWSALYESTPVTNYSGLLAGTKTGTAVSLTLTPAPAVATPECSYTYNATLSTSTLMAGTFVSFNCPNGVVDSGTLTLTKQ